MPRLADPKPWYEIVRPKYQELLDQIAEIGPNLSAAAITSLRRDAPADLVNVAIEAVAARRAAAGRIDSAATLLADVSGVQQATSSIVARYKAARLRERGVTELLDLCCGIGGDAIEFTAAGIIVTGVDGSPARCVMAEYNAGIETICADVERIDIRNRIVHIDPARRDERTGRRLYRLDDYQPGSDFLKRVLTECDAAAIKLGPGVDADELPRDASCELEFISVDGTLVQAVLWSGRVAGFAGAQRATMLPGGDSIAGVAGSIPLLEDDRTPAFLFVPDPALERARLVHMICDEHGVCELWPGLGVLGGASMPATPWLTAFKILADMPWRESKVRQWLHEHNAGIVEVKTRGKAVDPTPLQPRLRGSGDEPFTVLIYRLGRRVHAYCCRRVGRSAAANGADHSTT